MVIRHASLPISAIFENIEQAADQEEAINAYIRGPLWRFLNWYNKNDFYELSTVLDYKPEQWPDAQIVSYLSELEGLSTYPVQKQKEILEAIMCTLEPGDMMLMENCFTKDLKSYYPGIKWELFDPYVKVE